MKRPSKLGEMLNRMTTQTPESLKLQKQLEEMMPEKKSTSSSMDRAKNRSQSKKSEEDIELMTGLKRNPGSGCGKLFKGDNGNKLWHIEDKSTRQNRITFKRNWIEKAQYQAKITHKPYYSVSYTITHAAGYLRYYQMTEMQYDILKKAWPLMGHTETTENKTWSTTLQKMEIHLDLMPTFRLKFISLDDGNFATVIVNEYRFLELLANSEKINV